MMMTLDFFSHAYGLVAIHSFSNHHQLQKRKKEFIKEALALSKLDHPLIGKLEAVFIDGTNGYLQMTHYRGGSLSDYLEYHQSNNKKIDLRLTWTLFAKISPTLTHIHDRGIIHCDINVSSTNQSQTHQPCHPHALSFFLSSISTFHSRMIQ